MPAGKHFTAPGSPAPLRERSGSGSSRSGANPVWTVFNPEGRVLGFVETPAGLDIYEIGEDYILGLATDELGVEYMQVWALERSG